MKLTDAARQLGRKGGKVRAKKYDHETLSKWAKRGGRPRKDGQVEAEQKKSASQRSKERRK
jgi:hypothetical protein